MEKKRLPPKAPGRPFKILSSYRVHTDWKGKTRQGNVTLTPSFSVTATLAKIRNGNCEYRVARKEREICFSGSWHLKRRHEKVIPLKFVLNCTKEEKTNTKWCKKSELVNKDHPTLPSMLAWLHAKMRGVFWVNAQAIHKEADPNDSSWIGKWRYQYLHGDAS